ncbi:hypothetical protein [Sphingomonas sp. S2-65]|uniref:hypothetical protein n=1 Tax=Sphingomonas sp. S2-65 TaxID=2903960 RepID=UPI001F2961CF|nr:hypothetical protein [Sphingomonas sp. S2-65]UYY60110.1 hypothetical protein LZ586_08545 [Sphingomonas sp. S2-65]
MIEFLQSYETTAVPKETFEAKQRVDRSEDSELYFVRLGVAAYVTADGLVDQDHRPIVTETVVAQVVTPGDRRFGLGGRAGELALGLDAPQRATSGPGNAVLVGGDQQTASAGAEIERLTAELANSAVLLREMDETHVTARDALIADLDAEKARHADTRDELARVKTELAAADAGRSEAESALAAEQTRAGELEAQLAETTKPVIEQQQGDTPAPAKPGRGK